MLNSPETFDFDQYGADRRRALAFDAQLNAASVTDPARERANSNLRFMSAFPIPMWDETVREMAQIRVRQSEVAGAVSRAPRLAPFLADQRNFALAADDLRPLANTSAALDQIQVSALSLLRRGVASGRSRIALSSIPRIPGTMGIQNPNAPNRIAGKLVAGAAAAANEGAAGFLRVTYDLLSGRTFGARGVNDGVSDALKERGLLPQDYEPDLISRYLQGVQRQMRTVMQENRIETGNEYLDAALGGVQSVPLQLAALYVAARGDPRSALAMMASVSGGQAYGEAREAGLSRLQALTYSLTQGGLEAIGEALPVFRFLKDMMQGSGFVRTVGGQLLNENIGEQFTAHTQDFVQWQAIESNRGRTFADYMSERPRVIRDTFIATTAAVGLQTPVARIILRAVQQAGESDEAQRTSRGIDALMQSAADSRLRRESPEDFRELIEQQLGETTSENIYIPAEQVRQLFQSPQDMADDAFWGDYASQINEAEALNGDIVIPLAHAVTNLAGTPQWEALKDHVRTSGGGMSRAEAQDAEANMTQTLAEAVPELAAELAANEAAEAPRQQVFEAMRDKLTAAGFTPDAASNMAETFATRAATRAARLGRELTGAEADAVDVRSGDAEAGEGRSFAQPGTPEFQNWFGKSKVVDESGKPLVVYRGTTHPSEIIEPSGQNGDMLGRGVYLTNNKSYAEKFGDKVEAFYVSAQNVIDERDAPKLGGQRLADWAQRNGYDAIRAQVGQGTWQLVVFDPTSVKSVDNVGTYDPNDPRILNQQQRGRITFTADGRATIDLFAARDLSTFLHESGHLYLEELKTDAAIGVELGTPEGQQLAADFETVKAWFAKEGHAVADDGTIPTEAHEMFARGFERYAMEGKAPSTGLKRAFEAFRSWLINIYKTVRGLNAPITPEVRDVMARLLATDEEIAAAIDEQNIKLGFTSAAEAGMTEAEYAAYTKAATEATDDAHSALLRKVMATVRAARTKEYRAQEAEARGEVTETVDAQPVFRALAMLRGRETPVKLDRQFLLDSYGEDALDRMPRSVPPIYSDSNTVHPDVIAEETGFTSGDEMIRSLMAHEASRQEMKAAGDKRSPRQAAIDEATAEVMAQEYGDPLRDGSIEEEALAIIHNDKQGEVFATELRALGRQTGKRPTAYSIARQWAAERIASGRVVGVASGSAIQRYRRSAAKSGRAFEEALAKGDKNEAFRHKQAQMLNNALVSAAREAKDRIDVAVRRLGKLAKRKTLASMDQDYLEQIHGLLEQVEFRARSQESLNRQQGFEAWAAEHRDAGFDIVVPDSFAASLGTTHWSRLSVEQLVGLDETVKQIAHLGRLKQSLLDGQEKRKFAEARDEMIATADGSGKGRKITANNDPRRSLPERFKSRIRAADAFLIKTEMLVDWLDGGNSNGPWNRMLFRPVADAQGAEGDLMRSYVEKINALVKAMPRKQARDWDRFVETPELIDRVSSDPALHGRAFRFGKDQIVMMALNWGNDGNRQRLLDGYGWSEAQVQAVFDRHMTAEDWRFVQDVWDILEELKAPLFEMERRVNGVEPETVQAVPFDTPHGPMKGGYFPAVYDTTYQTKKELKDAEQRIAGGGFFRATTRSSATKERAAEVRRPLLLGMSVITNHMRDVIHDITHREAVQQVGKILADGQIRAAIDRKLGPEYVKALDGWLDDVAKPGAAESVLGPAMTRIGRWLHRGISVAGLGYRVSTVIVQPLGLSNAVGMVGERAVSEGMAIFTAHPIRTYREVTERSAEMRDRFSTMDASIADMYRDQAKAGLGRIGPGRFAKHAFDGILYADLLITTGIWIGSFNKGLREGMTEEDAAYYADKIVRTSQGAGGAKDRSWALRMPHIVRTLYPFFSYLNALYSQQRDVGRAARNAGSVGDVANVVRRGWWIAVVPTLAQALLFGDGPDEDDEESWASYLARSAAVGNLSSIPGIGPIATAVGNGWNYRASSVQQVGEGVVQAARDVEASLDSDPDSEPRGNWIKNLFATIGVITGQPLSQPGASAQFLYDVATGEAEPQDFGDWREGLTTGRIREDQ